MGQPILPRPFAPKRSLGLAAPEREPGRARCSDPNLRFRRRLPVPANRRIVSASPVHPSSSTNSSDAIPAGRRPVRSKIGPRGKGEPHRLAGTEKKDSCCREYPPDNLSSEDPLGRHWVRIVHRIKRRIRAPPCYGQRPPQCLIHRLTYPPVLLSHYREEPQP